MPPKICSRNESACSKCDAYRDESAKYLDKFNRAHQVATDLSSTLKESIEINNVKTMEMNEKIEHLSSAYEANISAFHRLKEIEEKLIGENLALNDDLQEQNKIIQQMKNRIQEAELAKRISDKSRLQMKNVFDSQTNELESIKETNRLLSKENVALEQQRMNACTQIKELEKVVIELRAVPITMLSARPSTNPSMEKNTETICSCLCDQSRLITTRIDILAESISSLMSSIHSDQQSIKELDKNMKPAMKTYAQVLRWPNTESRKPSAKKPEEIVKNKLPAMEYRHNLANTRLIKIIAIPREIDQAQLRTRLCIYNPFIKPENIEITRTYNVSNCKRPYRNAIVRCDVESFVQIIENGSLNFGNRSLRIFDEIELQCCVNCRDYGHSTKACRNKIACKHCAGDHNVFDCPNKSQNPVCANCSRRNLPADHSANSFRCPIRATRIDKFKATRQSIETSIENEERELISINTNTHQISTSGRHVQMNAVPNTCCADALDVDVVSNSN